MTRPKNSLWKLLLDFWLAGLLRNSRGDFLRIKNWLKKFLLLDSNAHDPIHKGLLPAFWSGMVNLGLGDRKPLQLPLGIKDQKSSIPYFRAFSEALSSLAQIHFCRVRLERKCFS